MKRYSLNQLSESLRTLGVQPGDTLMVRADLGAIGPIEGKDRNGYIAFILDVLGAEGTLIGLSFTGCTSSRKQLRNMPVFDGSNKPYTGAFANLMLKYPGSVRSRHPSNSYVGIGRLAKEILSKHDETAGAYDPVRDVMARSGKMLLIGCAGSSPGFTTTHLAEVDLGHHKRIMFPRRYRCRYLKDGEIKTFRRPDLGSCSPSFYKMYGFYAKEEILFQGFTGNAYSLLVDAQNAYEIDRAQLIANPRATICENPLCSLCSTQRWDNLHAYPNYFFRKAYSRLRRRMLSIVSPSVDS